MYSKYENTTCKDFDVMGCLEKNGQITHNPAVKNG
jgi:hypothetical protein